MKNYLLLNLNNLNRFEQGLFVITLGIIFVIASTRFHKRKYQDVDVKPFKSIKIEGKSDSENNLFIMFYYRSLFSIYLGYFLVICGFICIIAHFS